MKILSNYNQEAARSVFFAAATAVYVIIALQMAYWALFSTFESFISDNLLDRDTLYTIDRGIAALLAIPLLIMMICGYWRGLAAIVALFTTAWVLGTITHEDYDATIAVAVLTLFAAPIAFMAWTLLKKPTHATQQTP